MYFCVFSQQHQVEGNYVTNGAQGQTVKLFWINYILEKAGRTCARCITSTVLDSPSFLEKP